MPKRPARGLTVARFRALALALPEVSEEDHWGKPSFRVKGKILATLWVAERRAVLKLGLDEQEAWCQAEPEVFRPTAWAHQGWTSVELDRVDSGLLEKLLQGAWKRVAPKRLVRTSV